MTSDVSRALGAFIDRYQRAWPLLTAVFDPKWRSPCECGPPDEAGRVPWAPKATEFIDHFQGLENALEEPVHEDIKQYYGNYWSGGLEAEADEGHVSLILLWNEADAERLIENQIGHVLTSRRMRTPLSLFFACTEPDSELILTVRNATGEVVLERPGTRHQRVVAPSLAAFIDTLRPAPPELHPEHTLAGERGR